MNNQYKPDFFGELAEIYFLLAVLVIIGFVLYYWYISIPVLILVIIGFNVIEGIAGYARYIG